MKGKAQAIEDARVEQKRHKQSVEEKKVLAQLWSHLLPLFDHTWQDSRLNSQRIKHYLTNCVLSEKQTSAEGARGQPAPARGERSLSNSHDGPQDLGPEASQEGNIDNSKLGEGQDEDGSPNSRRDADNYEIESVQPALVRPYVDHNEVEHISVELEERRSE
ncbi:hypothetical protein EDB86DRAFT_3138093 [Lactarius hatsudake]|nr:hypothetical protein EDB86DRAFT_3138093 [Lactarius hatsudake]